MAVWALEALCFPWEENLPPFIERAPKEKEDLHENRVLKFCNRAHSLTQRQRQELAAVSFSLLRPLRHIGTLIPETNSSFCLSQSMGPREQGPSLASGSFYALFFRLHAQELLKYLYWYFCCRKVLSSQYLTMLKQDAKNLSFLITA